MWYSRLSIFWRRIVLWGSLVAGLGVGLLISSWLEGVMRGFIYLGSSEVIGLWLCPSVLILAGIALYYLCFGSADVSGKIRGYRSFDRD